MRIHGIYRPHIYDAPKQSPLVLVRYCARPSGDPTIARFRSINERKGRVWVTAVQGKQCINLGDRSSRTGRKIAEVVRPGRHDVENYESRIQTMSAVMLNIA
jgi:hypothetical protein